MLDAAAHYHEGFRTSPDDLSLADAVERARAGGGFVWISLVDPSEHELGLLHDGVALHELAVEDVLSPHERPKFDDYDGEAYLMVLRTAHTAPAGTVVYGELAVYVTDGLVVSARKGGPHEQANARATLERRTDLLANGVSAVLWAIIDRVLNDIRPVVDALDERLAQLETDVFDPTSEDLTRRVYELRQELTRLHRAIHPMLDPLRQNDAVRKISGWAACAVVPTLIAGVYGMNFHDIPGLSWRPGFWVCLAMMLAIALSLRAALRRAGWM